MKSLVLFASGKDSNVQAIIDYFRDKNKDVKINAIITTSREAGVLNIAKKENIEYIILPKIFLEEKGVVLYFAQLLKYFVPDLIIFAGFLWKMPKEIIQIFPNKIINIHPSLLPKYGGKGMYGKNVHNAVIEAKEKESGITIHYVNEEYDSGDIICQVRCNVEENETADSLANKIHSLEHFFFPRTIEFLLESKNE